MKKVFKVLGVWALMFVMLVVLTLLFLTVGYVATLDPVVGGAIFVGLLAAVVTWGILS